MKKTYVQYTDNTVELSRRDGSEMFALYIGVKPVYGEYILETSGNATCMNGLEEADASELIDSINAIIANPDTPWEALDANDEQYVADTLKAWGI